MANNTIPLRLYDFMKHFPPFNLLSKEQLLEVAGQVVVKYQKPGSVIFSKGDLPLSYFFVVKEGAVQIVENEDTNDLVEQCGEGDIFGIRPLLADEPYGLSAIIQEETLLLAIDTNIFKQLMKENPDVAYYFAISFAANDNPRRIRAVANKQGNLLGGGLEGKALVEIQSVERSKAPVICGPEATIQDAALIMTEKMVGSIIIVNQQEWPIGIATDKDLRSKVATGKFPLSDNISKIMSSPVITIPTNITMADVQIKMLQRKINHLCVTKDGTDQSRVVGVISEHDLLVLRGNNPAILIKEIQRTNEIDTLYQIRLRADHLLYQYLHQEVSISFITSIISAINDALICRAIILSMEGLEAEGQEKPEVSFCWMTLGSEGREEQLLKTDQDSALVFNTPNPEDLEKHRAYYLELARRVTKIYYEIGFEYCPAEMMASNPKWCLSLEEWKVQFSNWINEPTAQAVLNSNIFFDFRPVYGDKNLTAQLTKHIFDQLEEPSLFLSFMARYTVETPPPLTFFRNFVIEKSGDHKNEFDIKKRAMMPLTDAARLLILRSKVGKVNNTFRRFEKLAELEPRNRELYVAAADAYELFIRYRAIQGFKKKNNGRYINPTDLSKTERLNLRNSFLPIRSLQSLIETRFQLGYIR